MRAPADLGELSQQSAHLVHLVSDTADVAARSVFDYILRVSRQEWNSSSTNRHDVDGLRHGDLAVLRVFSRSERDGVAALAVSEDGTASERLRFVS